MGRAALIDDRNTPICVTNLPEESVTVDVTIVETDTDETVLNVVQGGENYQITASTDGGLTNSYEWDVRRESPRLANSLHILVDADRIGIGLSSP